MRVAVKFCGGCNPRFDRGAAAELLKKRLPELNFRPALEGEHDASLIICGCPAACASRGGLKNTAFVLTDEKDIPAAEKVLRSLI